MAKGKEALPQALRDRVVSFERIPARDLQSHDGNWRRHPEFQQQAMAGVLRDVGIAGALLVYRSAAHDGALVTIDGHLRKSLNPDQEWPCLILDVDDDEAAYILTTHDYLGTLVEADTERLKALLDDVNSGEAAVQQLLSQLASDEGIIPPDDPAEHWQDMPEFHQEDKLGIQQIIMHFDTHEDVAAFAQLVAQNITEKTKSLWYPAKERGSSEMIVA